MLRTYVGRYPAMQLFGENEDYYPRISQQIVAGKSEGLVQEPLRKGFSDRTHRIDVAQMRPVQKAPEEIEEVNAKERLQELRFAALKAEQDRILAQAATPEAQAYRAELGRVKANR